MVSIWQVYTIVLMGMGLTEEGKLAIAYCPGPSKRIPSARTGLSLQFVDVGSCCDLVEATQGPQTGKVNLTVL